MGQVVGIIVSVALVGGLLGLLYSLIRFSIISPRKTKGGKLRLRHPEPEGIQSVSGFRPPQELIDFYKHARFVESVEFHLIDRSKTPPVSWAIGAFSPLTPQDVREKRTVSGVMGIPIADDLDKGMYFVASTGAVMLRSPNIPGGETMVAPNIASFASFHESGGRRVKPPDDDQR